ncbi:MAG: creatininase family protein [Acidobacteriota bacterium]|nr:creatininase family protein [Acidobacteriota bacterium]
MRSLLILAAVLWVAAPEAAIAQGSPRTRDLSRINWMEFKEWVPSRVQTVLLPLGTLEPHGVTANGADILAPVAIASAIAPRLNAFVAPVVPYGMTGSMDAYAGAFTIPEEAYRPYVRAVVAGLARQGFRNIILLNGHGGGQTAVLNDIAQAAGRELRVRTLVINWWSLATDVTIATFGYDGGHAAENETAFMQAIDPSLVLKDRYTGPGMVTPNAAAGTYSAYPAPSSITLYKAGEGYPTFDEAKAKLYFERVNEKVALLIEDIIRKWNLAGVTP